MKKLIILILLLIPFCLKGQIKQDKYYHAGVGTTIAISSHLVFKSNNVNPYKGTLIATPIAFGKEIYDSYNGGRFSFADIGATILPTILIDTGVLIFKKKNKIINIDEFNPSLVKQK